MDLWTRLPNELANMVTRYLPPSPTAELIRQEFPFQCWKCQRHLHEYHTIHTFGYYTSQEMSKWCSACWNEFTHETERMWPTVEWRENLHNIDYWGESEATLSTNDDGPYGEDAAFEES